jgi:hypothetical protein
MSVIVSVGVLALHILLDALDVEVHNRLLSFVAQQEIAAPDAIHETVLSQAARAGCVFEDVKAAS